MIKTENSVFVFLFTIMLTELDFVSPVLFNYLNCLSMIADFHGHRSANMLHFYQV